MEFSLSLDLAYVLTFSVLVLFLSSGLDSPGRGSVSVSVKAFLKTSLTRSGNSYSFFITSKQTKTSEGCMKA